MSDTEFTLAVFVGVAAFIGLVELAGRAWLNRAYRVRRGRRR